MEQHASKGLIRSQRVCRSFTLHPYIHARAQVLLDHMYDAKPGEISQCLWGLARLRVPGAPGRAFLEAVCEMVMTGSYTAQQQQHPSEEEQPEGGGEQRGPVAADVAGGGVELVRRAHRSATHVVGHGFAAYSCQELSTVLWALARLHHYPGRAFLQHAESAMLRRLRMATAAAGAAGQGRWVAAPARGASGARAAEHQAGPPAPALSSQHQQAPAPPHLRQPPHAAPGAGVNGAAGHVPPPPPPPPLPGRAAQQQQQQQQQRAHAVSVSVPPAAAARQAPPQPALQLRPAPDARMLVPQDVSLTLWAFGRMRFKAVHLLDELPLCLPAWLPAFKPAELCALLAGYANARHYHRGLLEALAPLLANRAHQLPQSELVVALWAYGVFQHHPRSEPALFPALAAVLHARLRQRGGARPQAYALVYKACANLQFRPEPLLDAVVQAATQRLPDFRPDEMANLLYGISHLASRAPSCELPPPHSAARDQQQQQQQHAAPAADPSGGDGGDGAYPTLSPSDMQLFYGVVRQCIRVLDEGPNHPYGSRNFMHYQVRGWGGGVGGLQPCLLAWREEAAVSAPCCRNLCPQCARATPTRRCSTRSSFRACAWATRRGR